MTVIFQIKDAPSIASLSLRLRDVMLEKTIQEIPIPSNPIIQNGKLGGVLNLVGVKLESFGTYKASLLINGQEIASTSFTLDKV